MAPYASSFSRRLFFSLSRPCFARPQPRMKNGVLAFFGKLQHWEARIPMKNGEIVAQNEFRYLAF